MATNKRDVLSELDDVDESSEHPDDEGKLSPGPGRESFKLAQFWKAQVEAYDQATRRWTKRGNTVIKRYRDERSRVSEEGTRRMNLLWANIQVMKPAIYSKCPIPVVDRKFLDRDPIGRLSSQIMERSLRNEQEKNGFHSAIGRAVNDKLLPGRGVVWLRYVPKIGEGDSIPAYNPEGIEDPLFDIGKETGDKELLDDTDKEEQLEESQEQVLSEKTEVDYVDWRDFYHFPVKARTWEEVQAIGKKVYISKKEAIERFGEKIGKALRPDTTPITSSNQRLTYSDTSIFQDINERAIVIYEIWNKTDERAYWLSSGYEYLCDIKDDPLELEGFFPTPKPLFSTMTNDTLIPVPDYIEWQDQAIQIDELTQRIHMLTKACKVAGVYNASNPNINRIFNESLENELVPVDQWAMFAEGGGLKGAIDFVPIDQIQSCIETLQKVRQQAQIDLDQVTGLSDVIRGTSDSRETLGGLRLKNNNAGTRLSESQEEVARFARDVVRLTAEIMCKHFADETLIESSGIIYEDALQPDTIMRELEAGMSKPQPQQAPQQMHPQLPPMGQGAPQAQLPPPMPGAQPGAPQPQIGAPGAMHPAMPPQQPGQNIIPFPGGQQPPQQNQLPTPLIPQLPPDPQIIIMRKIQKALELLRNDITRSYRIDIETDSTIFGDKYQDKQDANEFLTALGSYMKGFESAATSAPESMPMLAKALQWGTRKFRVGRDLEAEIDNFVTLMTKKAKQLAENPPPSADMVKAQAEAAQTKLEGQIQAQNDQRDAARQAQDDQREMQMEQARNNRETQKMQQEFEIEKMRAALEKEKMQNELQFMREEHTIKMRELQAQSQAKVQDSALQVHSQALDIQHREQEHNLDVQDLHHKKKESEQKHQLKMKEQKQKSKEKKAS